MSFLGLGEILGGQIIGLVRDYKNNKFAIICEMALCAISFIVVLVFNRRNQFNNLAYVMCFAWGL